MTGLHGRVRSGVARYARRGAGGDGTVGTVTPARSCQWIDKGVDPRDYRRRTGAFEGIHCGAPVAPGRPYCPEHYARSVDHRATREAAARARRGLP